MFVVFDDVWVYVCKRRLARERAYHVRKYPSGRERLWEGMTPTGALYYEIVEGEKDLDMLTQWASDYLDWEEVPKVSELPHFEERWTSGDYEWRLE